MLRSLVGSEMCIRDRYQRRVRGAAASFMMRALTALPNVILSAHAATLLYQYTTFPKADQMRFATQLLGQKLVPLAVLNLWFAVLVSTWRAVRDTVFRRLHLNEMQVFRESLWEYVLFKFVFIGMVLEPQFTEIVIWNAVFLGSGTLTVITNVASKRLSYLIQDDPGSDAQWVFWWFTTGLLAAVVAWCTGLTLVFGDAQWATMVFLLAQPCISLLNVCQLLFKQVAHGWANSKQWISNSEYAKDLVVLSLSLLTDLHLWMHSGVFWSFFDVILFMHARKVFSKLVQCVRQYQASCRLQSAAEPVSYTHLTLPTKRIV
eukprot:TRINITY_DN7138_c0_g1_i4.p1 TRINITY_DN7138_c0_g1~~TRINITY_DN7138_c0_g1_i4.p1  ORF type:complete len:362 (-),score=92.67 TRINITY_DN7138_c0_g1_i4:116-1069(-)